MSDIQNSQQVGIGSEEESDGSFGEMLGTLRDNLKLLTLVPIGVGIVALVFAMLIPPTYTAVTTFMPPQQPQSSAASALASLGPLAGLAGGAAGLSSPGERYVALMQSITVTDRIVDQFKLMEVYEKKFRVDTRKILSSNVRIGLGKKDGLITIEVDDKSPERAADIANRYVDELRRITGLLAVTEAQQRRVFFERQLQQSRDRLAQAQQTLQTSGFNAGALRAEPKAAAEAYARLKAETTATELRLQVLRGTLADDTPEVRQLITTLATLREGLARVERATESNNDTDYVSKYREFKYQETLFELYARQFEIARADESREGALIQVVDPASAPERKSKPKRAQIVITAFVGSLLLMICWVQLRHALRRANTRRADPAAMR